MRHHRSFRLPTTPLSRRARGLAALLIATALAAAGCGGSGHNLSQCGNDRIDSGEQCDDGNVDDHDGCTAVCRNARCGDGTVEVGVEQCDQFDLNNQGCDTLGYAGAGGNLRCTASCQFDISLCGPAFTPTHTVTPTVFAPSPTPTATPPPLPCGDGLLQTGQTCEECPADCQASPCEPNGERAKFIVVLDIPLPQKAQSTTLLLAYRSSVLSIPGSGSDPGVRQRVRPLPPLPQAFTVDDLNYAVRISARQPNGLNTDFASADFDVCSGAPPPTTADLSCTVEGCESASRPLTGCACQIQPNQP